MQTVIDLGPRLGLAAAWGPACSATPGCRRRRRSGCSTAPSTWGSH